MPLTKDPFSSRAPVVLVDCGCIVSRLAAYQVFRAEQGGGSAQCPVCQAPMARSSLQPVVPRIETFITSELTRLRSKQKEAALPAGFGPNGSFSLARWLHQLNFVHRSHVRVPRQLLTHLPRSPAWTLRQKHHEPPPATDLPTALAVTVHLQHLPLGITREPAPDVWCAGFAELAPYVAQMSSLRSIELAYVALLDTPRRARAVLEDVVAAATQLEHLALLRTGRIGSDTAPYLLHMLRALPRLRSLELSGIDLCGADFESVWALVPALPHLSSLDLSNNDAAAFTNFDLWGDQQAPELSELHLQENQLGDGACSRLSSYIPAMPRLARLTLRCNALSDDGTEALAAALQTARHLTELDLSANRALDMRGAAALAHHLPPGLLRLDVSARAMSDDAERVLSQLPCWPYNEVIEVVIASRGKSVREEVAMQTRVSALTERLAFSTERVPEAYNLYFQNRLLPASLTMREAGVQHNARLTFAPAVVLSTTDSSSSDHDVTT